MKDIFQFAKKINSFIETTAMLIQHKETNKQGIFYITDEHEHQVAELIYTLMDPGRMVIEHTQVDESLQGQNVGTELVMASAEYARVHNMKIIPHCPFARVVFERHHELGDLVMTTL